MSRDAIKIAYRRANEKALEAELTKYILSDSKFAFGGVYNLLTTIADLCKEQSKLEGDDWAIAAQLIDDFADKCDLKYPEGE